MRRCKTDAEQTRTAILDAAEHMFCEQGIAASTLEKISRRAGVTRGAVYWHFKDKIDLLRALHKRSEPPQKLLIRMAAESRLPGARRSRLMREIARAAAMRLLALTDPAALSAGAL